MVLLGSCLIAATSCKKYLDVNTNPNSPIDVTPDLILPAALAQTASDNVTFNSYGAWAGGYQANAGGYGGFGSVLTYNYSTNDNNGLWSQSFSNLNDYQTIINKTDATGPYKNYFAIAKIMKAFCYLRLIDVYNDVPYSDALKGIGNLTPKYDKAEDIYKGLFGEINEAITALALPNNKQLTIKTSTSPNSSRIDIFTSGQSDAAAFESADGFPTAKWTQFANTLKLKMLVRIRQVPSLATTFTAEKAKLAGATFVTYDVKAQPGYVAGQNGKQNPSWNAYAYTYTGGTSNLTTIPTFYALGFYDGHKLTDDVRGWGAYAPTITYREYTTGNQLGITDAFVKAAANPGGSFFTGTNNTSASTGYGTLKGAIMAQPIMLAAESYFIQAEANLFGIVAGNDAENFAKGIRASQRYLLTGANEALQPDYAAEADAPEGNGAGLDSYQYYIDQNAGNYLVDYAVAASNDEKLEAIITQKWLAENYIQSNEGWSDFRRTGYPSITIPAGTSSANVKYFTFASVQSVSTRPDKLPVRVLYPASEYALNPTNVPSGINAFTSRVFYDLN